MPSGNLPVVYCTREEGEVHTDVPFRELPISPQSRVPASRRFTRLMIPVLFVCVVCSCLSTAMSIVLVLLDDSLLRSPCFGSLWLAGWFLLLLPLLGLLRRVRVRVSVPMVLCLQVVVFICLGILHSWSAVRKFEDIELRVLSAHADDQPLMVEYSRFSRKSETVEVSLLGDLFPSNRRNHRATYADVTFRRGLADPRGEIVHAFRWRPSMHDLWLVGSACTAQGCPGSR